MGRRMSYDVVIGGESFNYTYNLSPLFYRHFPKNEEGEAVGLRLIDGMTGKSASKAIGRFWDSLNDELLSAWRHHEIGAPTLCSKYDPDNGWGSLVGAMIFIGHIQTACANHTRNKVRVL